MTVTAAPALADDARGRPVRRSRSPPSGPAGRYAGLRVLELPAGGAVTFATGDRTR